MIMKVYVYIRVSHDEDKKKSIDTQRKGLEAYATECGMLLVDVYEDNDE